MVSQNPRLKHNFGFKAMVIIGARGHVNSREGKESELMPGSNSLITQVKPTKQVGAQDQLSVWKNATTWRLEQSSTL